MCQFKIKVQHHSARLLSLLLLMIPMSGWSEVDHDQQALAEMEALLEVDFESLANISLTTAARKEQRLLDTTAAVYVIDQEEIRRSGMTSIPELLRLVPGLHVGHINGSNWAISARGFNAQYSNKLLVLMDGRTLYTPLYAGVDWDSQDLMLENIDRIEVIRGPGGTLWGANAVNGIINIITKKAEKTQGSMLSVGGGNIDKFHGDVRYGGRVGNKMAYRIYAKGLDRGELDTASAAKAGDSWGSQRGGFRTDWQLSKRDELTLQGDIYDIHVDQTDIDNSGGNILLRWTRNHSDLSNISLQLYYDHTSRSNSESRHTYDMDLQHRFSPLTDHELIWGLGYRVTHDDLITSNVVSWIPSSQRDVTFSAFLQDEITLITDRLKMTVGTKVERNDYTNWEVQPSTRLLWQVSQRHTLWAAISRAIRSPSRTDSGFQLNINNGPLTVATSGNPDIESETLMAYEIGYRTQPTDQLFLDVTGFYHDYSHLLSTESLASANPLMIASRFDNKMAGKTYGIETALHWQVQNNWKLKASHSWLQMALERDADSTDTTSVAAEGHLPRQQFQLRSYLNLPHDLEFDAALYYVGRLSGLSIPAYSRVDTRLGWQPRKEVSLSLSIHNMFDDQHPEFDPEMAGGLQQSEIPRAIFAKLTWSF